jgi:hypothetical protein
MYNIVACWVCHATNKFSLSRRWRLFTALRSCTLQLCTLQLYHLCSMFFCLGSLALLFSCLWPWLDLHSLGLSRSSADGIQDAAKVRFHVFGSPLVRKRLVSSVVTQRTFHFWGNAFVDSTILMERLTVITLPWKCLLQTRYITPF